MLHIFRTAGKVNHGPCLIYHTFRVLDPEYLPDPFRSAGTFTDSGSRESYCFPGRTTFRKFPGPSQRGEKGAERGEFRMDVVYVAGKIVSQRMRLAAS